MQQKETKSELDNHFSDLEGNKPYDKDCTGHIPSAGAGATRPERRLGGDPARPDGAALHQSQTAGTGAQLDRKRLTQTPPSGLKTTNCPNPVGFFNGRKNDCVVTIPAPCKRWDCPVCGVRKKNILADRIRDGFVRIANDTTLFETRRTARFLTLTLHIDDPVEVMTAWNRFQATLTKHGIDDKRYFLVKEFTKRGKRHLHILTNYHIPPDLLTHAWRCATEGKSYITHIRRVEGNIRSPAGYITKYLVKGWKSNLWRKHEKRFTHDTKTDWSVYTTWKPPEGWVWEFVYCPSPVTFTETMRHKIDERMRGQPPPDDGMMPEGIPGGEMR